MLSDTTLRCENPEPDDGDPNTLVDQNPITFADGVEYRIAGNTLAYLVEILDAIDGLAGYIEDAIGDDAFTEPLPVVGVSAAEIGVSERRRGADPPSGRRQRVLQLAEKQPVGGRHALGMRGENAVEDQDLAAGQPLAQVIVGAAVAEADLEDRAGQSGDHFRHPV